MSSYRGELYYIRVSYYRGVKTVYVARAKNLYRRQNSSSRGMHNGGERAVFQALAEEELSRESRGNFMIWEKKRSQEEDGTEINRLVERREEHVLLFFVPSGCIFSSRLSAFFPEDKSIAWHILIRRTSIMPLKTDNGTYSVKLLRAFSLPLTT